MGWIAKLSSIKSRSTSRRQGLRELSRDLIGKARDETATQVTRVGLTFLGTAAFCLLSLLTPDSALLGGNEKINLPLAGPVSFFGFMLLGPALLIVLRVYLQIYVEHGARLDRLARSASVVRMPTFVPLDNPLIRLFSGSIFYMLLPVATMLFAWKASVFPAWGSGLSSVAVAVIASHVMLPFNRPSWRSKALLSISVATITGGVILGFGLLHRPFELYHANLSGYWLPKEDLGRAHLSFANLSGAGLSEASLSGADLSSADLSGADLSGTDLSGARLSGARLSGANLADANLSGANLGGANLSGANLFGATLTRAYLSQSNLSGANLGIADLSGASLYATDLSKAKLYHTDLSGADLSGADVSGADLEYADLSGANLGDAQNLTQTELDKACGNANTKLPEGLTIQPCIRPSEPSPTGNVP